jgi:hypothetical protein
VFEPVACRIQICSPTVALLWADEGDLDGVRFTLRPPLFRWVEGWTTESFWNVNVGNRTPALQSVVSRCIQLSGTEIVDIILMWVRTGGVVRVGRSDRYTVTARQCLCQWRQRLTTYHCHCHCHSFPNTYGQNSVMNMSEWRTSSWQGRADGFVYQTHRMGPFRWRFPCQWLADRFLGWRSCFNCWQYTEMAGQSWPISNLCSHDFIPDFMPVSVWRRCVYVSGYKNCWVIINASWTWKLSLSEHFIVF